MTTLQQTSAWTGGSGAVAPLWWFWAPVAAFALLLGLSLGLPSFYDRWIDGEFGANENLHTAMLFAGGWVACQALLAARRQDRRWLAAWCGLAAVCCFLVFGEELSWGQHFFGWSTPEEWAQINAQEETNLHNVHKAFNTLPRFVLFIGIIGGGILLPLAVRYRPWLARLPAAIVFPPLIGMPLAILLSLVGLVRADGPLGNGDFEPFRHPSEVQELFAFWYVLLYLVVLLRRIRQSTLEGVGD